MKKLFFGALVACVAATFVACGNSTPKADLKNDVDTMSYAMGMSQTQGLKEFMVERMGVDTAYMDDFIRFLTRWLRVSIMRYSVTILPRLSL